MSGPLRARSARSARRGALTSMVVSIVAGGAASALLLVASPASAKPGAEPAGERLTVVAAGSARPLTCARSGRVWQRVGRPRAARACDLLLQGSARLAGDPRAALALAEEASELVPDRAAPRVLVARARLALGDFAEAARGFAAAEELDAGALRAPMDLLAAARAAASTGDFSTALRRYRRLVPRASLLADDAERQRALLEAALVAQAVSPELLGEARAYAAEVRRQGSLYYADLARAVLALALDREGRFPEAVAVAAELDGVGLLEWLFERDASPRGRPGEVVPVWPDVERDALVAVVAEPIDPSLAAQAWEEYLRRATRARAPRHLLDHARRRLAERGVDVGGLEQVVDGAEVGGGSGESDGADDGEGED